MTNVDQFESLFNSAAKPAFAAERVAFETVLVITDSDAAASEQFRSKLKSFCSQAACLQSATWSLLDGGDYGEVSDLLRQVEQAQPDLICTYRNLRLPALEHPYSLGVLVDVLAQTASAPLLLAPHPRRPNADNALTSTKQVMAITDHLTGDQRLVNVAAAMTRPGGSLHLTHVENEAVFERYLDVIGKIPTINTDEARNDIREQLLKEPHDYIRSCREVLESNGSALEVREHILLGHQLNDYKRLLDENNIELLVMNTKDDDQLAMHGLAYPLAVELRDTPLLLL